MEEKEAFRALGSADRQILLYVLVTGDDPVTVEDLSRKVAAGRHQTRPEKTSDDKIERALVRLVHVHLPMLADMDIIERDGDTVTLNDDACREQLIESAELLDIWPPDGLRASSAA